mmetsp:Transcript_40097/g.87540  ORF Transcript_40097/g.87540 Transcript_40097/m.87540 type:complete len:215 (-) Transcript_40097:22-666(-)
MHCPSKLLSCNKIWRLQTLGFLGSLPGVPLLNRSSTTYGRTRSATSETVIGRSTGLLKPGRLRFAWSCSLLPYRLMCMNRGGVQTEFGSLRTPSQNRSRSCAARHVPRSLPKSLFESQLQLGARTWQLPTPQLLDMPTKWKLGCAWPKLPLLLINNERAEKQRWLPFSSTRYGLPAVAWSPEHEMCCLKVFKMPNHLSQTTEVVCRTCRATLVL